MNTKQRAVLLLGAALLLAAGLYVPWKWVEKQDKTPTVERPCGYGLLFQAPQSFVSYPKDKFSPVYTEGHIDSTRLAIELVTIALVTAVLSLAFRESPTR